MINTELKERLDTLVKSADVVLFMKGNPEMPQCGFSGRVVGVLHHLKVPFKSVDILEEEEIRQGLKEYSDWPTFPQLYVKGDLVGGCDIILEMFKNGNLEKLMERMKKT